MTPAGIGGVGTPAQGVTMSLNPGDLEQEGVLTADIIRQQLKQHEDAAAKARSAWLRVVGFQTVFWPVKKGVE